jgi:hypothetical protein
MKKPVFVLPLMEHYVRTIIYSAMESKCVMEPDTAFLLILLVWEIPFVITHAMKRKTNALLQMEPCVRTITYSVMALKFVMELGTALLLILLVWPNSIAILRAMKREAIVLETYVWTITYSVMELKFAIQQGIAFLWILLV